MKKLIKKLLNIIFNSEDELIKELDKQGFNINLLDIGAAGNIEPRWLKIAKYINYVGIEPDDRSNKDLQNNYNCKSYKAVDTFLWDKKEDLTFYICKKPTCSSLLQPNREFLNKFKDSNRHDVVKKKKIKSSTIHNEFSKLEIDFIKIDTQGAELKILKGGEKEMANCLGLEIEVQFAELYKNASLFDQINSYLQFKDFIFIDFVNLSRWERYEYNTCGQIAFGDGLWLRSPEYINKYQSNKIYKYIAICSLYGRYDLIKKLIEIENLRLNTKTLIALKKQVKKQKFLRSIHSIFSIILGYISGNKLTTRSHLIY